MLVELVLVEQCHKAVLEVLEGQSVQIPAADETLALNRRRLRRMPVPTRALTARTDTTCNPNATWGERDCHPAWL